MAVEVIMTLEQQVRGEFCTQYRTRTYVVKRHRFLIRLAERNLNPKAACLKRREEEKADDGPKLPQHHMPYPTMPVSNITFDF